MARPAFDTAGDVFFHYFRRHTRVESQDLDGRCFEQRKNVGRDAKQRNDTDEEGCENADQHQVRISERATHHIGSGIGTERRGEGEQVTFSEVRYQDGYDSPLANCHQAIAVHGIEPNIFGIDHGPAERQQAHF